MPLSFYALDNFVAQDLSQLTECRAVPVAAEFPDYTTWLSCFVLNCIFRIPLPDGKKALAFALIRRAEGAIADCEDAHGYLQDFVSGDKNKISLYFRCLRRFESTVAMVWQALDFCRKALGGVKLFTEGDGTPYERLNKIYNNNRHSKPETLPAGLLHAVWIKNEGLFTDGASLTFDELRDLVRQIGSIADKLAKGEVPK